MSRVLRKAESPSEIRKRIGDVPNLDQLIERACNGSLTDRKRAVVILARLRGISFRAISRFLHSSRFSVRRRWDRYEQHGVQALFQDFKTRTPRKADDTTIQEAVLSVLHSRPSDFGLNRSTWRMANLKSCLSQKGLCLSHEVIRAVIKKAEPAPHQWVLRIIQKTESPFEIAKRLGDVPGLSQLVGKASGGSLRDRKRALAVLGRLRGMSIRAIARFLRASRIAVQKHWNNYQQRGVQGLFKHSVKCGSRKAQDERIQKAIFSVLHSPPSEFGINRTTWRMADLKSCLAQKGIRVSKDVIHEVIKAAGYKWRKAKTVLTSRDPEYREKLHKIQSILANLGDDERFFSIDEFGPFAIKMRGGSRLVGPNEYPSIPQFQKSKGSLIVTAALELSRNQVTHFYSKKKNTAEMMKLLTILLRQYKGCRRLYFSWDAASWHDSLALQEMVERFNSESYRQEQGTPCVEIAPLPANAQFLNVIESVFSGMARAIIHNSDYGSVEDAMAAIDRHLADRNECFRRHPKKAGKKIWGKERVPAQFDESHNCKDPRW